MLFTFKAPVNIVNNPDETHSFSTKIPTSSQG